MSDNKVVPSNSVPILRRIIQADPVLSKLLELHKELVQRNEGYEDTVVNFSSHRFISAKQLEDASHHEALNAHLQRAIHGLAIHVANWGNHIKARNVVFRSDASPLTLRVQSDGMLHILGTFDTESEHKRSDTGLIVNRFNPPLIIVDNRNKEHGIRSKIEDFQDLVAKERLERDDSETKSSDSEENTDKQPGYPLETCV